MITVLAVYRAITDRRGEVAVALREYTSMVNGEPGCIGFTSYQDTAEETVFVLFEQYTDRDAFEDHVASDHYKEVARQRIWPLLVDRQVRFLGELPGVGGTHFGCAG